MAIVTPAEPTADGRRRYGAVEPGNPEADRRAPRSIIAKAREAQPRWEAMGAKRRAEYLRKALAVLVRRQDELIDVIVRESGKPRSEALMIDVFAVADSLAYLSKNAHRWLKVEPVKTHGILKLTKKVQVRYQALGVVGGDLAVNGPLILSLNPAIQALIAGNTVVVKPSEVTPFSGKLAVDIFDEALASPTG